MSSSINYVASVLLKYATTLLSCSAETRLIIQTTERLSKAFGYNSEVVVAPTHIILTVKKDDEVCSVVKRVDGIGINMTKLYQLIRLCLDVEKQKVTLEEVDEFLKNLKNFSYHPLLMCFVIGVSTLGFSYLNGGSFDACVVGFFSGFITMAARLFMQSKHLFVLFIFAMSGFIATLVTTLISSFIYPLSNEDLTVALTVSVLLLVPGFPFMNGILDVFKGYHQMGLSRLFTATVLLASVCVGIISALVFSHAYFL